MEERFSAHVRLHATDTGDLVFACFVGPAGRELPAFAVSIPMDEARGLREDVERLMGAYAAGEPAGTLYGMEMTAAMAGTILGRSPLAVARLEGVANSELSPKVVGVECLDERWEYYCEEDKDGRR